MAHQRIIIVGKGGSGKDYLKNKFIDKGYNRCISTTTRPKREEEKSGISYNFVSEERFKEKFEEGEFYETDCFNGWHYGTTNHEWFRATVFIMTPRGVCKIKPEHRKDCFIIYLDISETIRFQRLKERNDADNVFRRLKADEEDFSNFTDFDLRITNPDF